MLTPVTSDGSRSGVNWMRPQVQSRLAATALARLVLPTPGTSSMSRWPSATRQTRARRMASSLPWTTRATLSTMASKASEKDWTVRAATRGVDDMECAHGTCCQAGTTFALVDLALAVDIGGTKLAAGLVSDDGEVLASATPPSQADSADGLFEVLRGVVDGVRGGAEVAVCGVGCGGPMTPGGEEVSPLNIGVWRGFPLRS